MRNIEEIVVDNQSIGLNSSPFIIAEMSGNHNKSLSNALKIVEVAAKLGVNAIKLQTYTPETMTIDVDDDEFYIRENKSLWKGVSLFNLYEKAYTPWEWHFPIFEHARKLNIVPFSTPFDSTAVDFLETLDTPCYKIASFENIDLPLIRKVAATGKPMIISTGMASLAELDEAVNIARQSGCKDLILLKCTSTYPASPENSNLLTLPHLRETFRCEVGLSDHTMGTAVAVASVALGATVIEKHITLDRSAGGVDSAFSMEPEEMRRLVSETFSAWQAMGRISYGPTEDEISSLQFRRSLYIVKDMQAGDILTKDCLRAIRPGNGLPPKYFDLFLGKKIRKDVQRGTPVDWSLLL